MCRRRTGGDGGGAERVGDDLFQSPDSTLCRRTARRAPTRLIRSSVETIGSRKPEEACCVESAPGRQPDVGAAAAKADAGSALRYDGAEQMKSIRAPGRPLVWWV